MFNWSIGSEFHFKYENKIKVSQFTKRFFNFIIKTLLLRNNDFFEKYLNNEEYSLFKEKIIKNKDTFGDKITDIQLYFTCYEFSDNLEKKILNLRNYFGYFITSLIIIPTENTKFNSDLNILHNDIKKFDKELNLLETFQEITFDMGCSSYALGKLYAQLKEIIYDFDSDKNEFSSSNYYKIIEENNIKLKNIIDILPLYNYDEDEINYIKEKIKNNYKLKFRMSNKLTVYFLQNVNLF